MSFGRWDMESMRHESRALLIALLIGAAVPAGDACADSLAWKLTVGEYAYADYYGTDVNLRWRSNDTSAWAAFYTDPRFGTQGRAGADTSIDIGKYCQVQP